MVADSQCGFWCNSGKLVGKRTKAPWMTGLSFADDAAIVTSSRDDLGKATAEF